MPVVKSVTKPVIKRQLLARCIFLACCGLPFSGAQAAYEEPGRPGSPDSWRTGEFKENWGLGSIEAEYAYARGYTGKGITIGVMDSKIMEDHPELAGRLRATGDTSYRYEAQNNLGREFVRFDIHGTHVAGIAAAARDGSKMHGVAYDARINNLAYENIKTDNGWESVVQDDTRIINNSWGPRTLGPGNRDILIIDTALRKNATLQASERPIDPRTTSADEFHLRAARNGKLIVYSAGNGGNATVPPTSKSMVFAFPDRVNSYLVVTNLTRKDVLHSSSTICGDTASFCVSAPGENIYSTSGKLMTKAGVIADRETFDRGEAVLNPEYTIETGTSMAAPFVSGAAAVLMQRFPYMTADQISVVLKTTATDLGAPGIDNLYGWGKINLRRAIDGPGMLIAPEDIPAEYYVPDSYTQTQFEAYVPGLGAVVEPGTPVARTCDTPECAFDTWRNDIAGHGGLTKTGDGTLALTGKNTYSGPTRVEEGALVVDGSLASAVTIGAQGLLAGNGRVRSLEAGGGGIVAPGTGIGTLGVDERVTFRPGSHYDVEVARGGVSDRIEAGSAVLEGGSVNVSLENRNNLLTQSEAESLLGEKYTILKTKDGVSGQFAQAAPAYPFIRIGLDYSGRDVGMNIARSDAAFESLALTQNEKAVARAVEALGNGTPARASAQAAVPRAVPQAAAGGEAVAYAPAPAVQALSSNAVYESFLGLTSARQVREATRQLSGQIHADVAASQLNESRTLRDTATERLRQAAGSRVASGIKADESGAWAKLLGNWGHASGSGGAAGYQSSTYGVLLGVDNAVADRARLGVMTGYTRTSLDGAHHSDADSDNWHLGVYGDGRADGFALRGGGGVTWHRIDASRRVAYGAQSDHDKDKYSAHTGQLFAEGAWTWQGEAGSVEPFANLAWAEYRSGRIREKGGAAALRGGKQGVSATTSTLGLRGDVQWAVAQAAVSLRAELGWQRQLDGRRRDVRLAFRDGGAGFNVNSVRASRDAAVMKAGLEVAVSDGAALSLGYGGLLSKRYQDNGVNAGFNWQF